MMALFISLWHDMLVTWFPDWEQNWSNLYGFLNGVDYMNGDNLEVIISTFHQGQLPDYLYLFGSILIVVLSLVALFALFKWMFTLVWRLFKID